MICHNCLKRVEYISGADWMDLIQSVGETATKEERLARILQAIRAWDQSQMYVAYNVRDKSVILGDTTQHLFDPAMSAQTSIMPTELRDALLGLMLDLGLESEAEDAAKMPVSFMKGI